MGIVTHAAHTVVRSGMSVLRYTSFTDALPRHEVPNGRRLASGGVLSGALHTLGYVSAVHAILPQTSLPRAGGVLVATLASRDLYGSWPC